MEFRTRILLAKALSLTALPVVPKPVFERKVKKIKEIDKTILQKNVLNGSNRFPLSCTSLPDCD